MADIGLSARTLIAHSLIIQSGRLWKTGGGCATWNQDRPGMGSIISDVAFIRGGIAGFALAAPLGPVAILCIRRALARGQIEAVLAGLGAAVADTIFGAVAGLGITFISHFVIAHEVIIGLLGGGIVLGVGLITYRTPVCHITGL